jgi:hypothetical protein
LHRKFPENSQKTRKKFWKNSLKFRRKAQAEKQKQEETDEDLDICGKCKKGIEDGGIKTSNNWYHEECFVCCKCNAPLQGGFKEKARNFDENCQ